MAGPWKPGKAPEQSTDDGIALAQFVEDELERFAADMAGNLDAIELRTTYNEPTRPQTGMLAYADGTKWNPNSAIGEGLFVRNSAGVWVPISSLPGGYAEGTWAPAVTFATPGNLSVAYATQKGFYCKVGNFVSATGIVVTSTFTHTTASGILQVTGLPKTSKNVTGYAAFTVAEFAGITKAGYTQVTASVGANSTTVLFAAQGSGVSDSSVTKNDTPSGGTLVLGFTLNYMMEPV